MSKGRLASAAIDRSSVIAKISMLGVVVSLVGCATTKPAAVAESKPPADVVVRSGIALAPPNLALLVQRDPSAADFASAIASRNDWRLGTPSPVITQSDEFVRWSFQRDQVVNGLSYTDYRRTTWVRQSSQP